MLALIFRPLLLIASVDTAVRCGDSSDGEILSPVTGVADDRERQIQQLRTPTKHVCEQAVDVWLPSGRSIADSLRLILTEHVPNRVSQRSIQMKRGDVQNFTSKNTLKPATEI